MLLNYKNPRLAARLVGAVTLVLATTVAAQSSNSSNSGNFSYYSVEKEPGYVRLARAELQDQPPEPPEPDDMPEEPAEVEPDTFESPFLATERPVRIARVPDMFGDFFGAGGQLIVMQENIMRQQSSLVSDLPMAGGSRRVKVGENNKALTDDRVYFLYNHFHNALQAQQVPPPFGGPGGTVRPFHVDRYTVGFEKSFICGLMSVELRLPLNGTFQFDSTQQMPMFTSDFHVQGGKVGNLAVLLKGLLLATDRSAIALGCGIDLPTGSDVRARTVFTQGEPTVGPPPVMDDLSLVIKNEALHLLPFLAVSHAPTENFFFHLFLQADVAANSNPVDVSLLSMRPGMPPIEMNQQLGKYTEQNFLHVDFAAGCWLLRNPDARVLQGLAGLVELHYTTSLQDTDNVQDLLTPIPPMNNVQITNVLNRVDVLNLTVGVHCDLPWDSKLRVAGVVPLSESEDDRFFDSEIWVSYIKQL